MDSEKNYVYETLLQHKQKDRGTLVSSSSGTFPCKRWAAFGLGSLFGIVDIISKALHVKGLSH